MIRSNYLLSLLLLAFPLASGAAGFTICSNFDCEGEEDYTYSTIESLCVGFDCLLDDVPGSTVIKLKENNTRIGWYDTSATAPIEKREFGDSTYVDGLLGNMWHASANESANGGANLFSFDMVSAEKYPVLSDGTLIRYDCTATPDYSTTPNTPYPENGLIPEGEPAETAFCQPLNDLSVSLRRAALGADSNDGVHLGGTATPSPGKISLGSPAENRPMKLTHLAASLEESSVLLKKTLDSYDLGSELGLDQLESQLDEIEQGIKVLEAAAAENADTDADTNNPFQGLFKNLGNNNKGGSSAMGPLGLLLLAPLLWFRRR